MEFFFRDQAYKQFRKLSPAIQKRIVEKLSFFSRQENPLDFAESLRDSTLGHYRFRVGDYRIVVDREDNRIKILLVGHRRDIYR